MTSIWSFCKAVLASAYALTITNPLKRLYYNGPRLYGYGFWRGVPLHDICASLTSYDSEFWQLHNQACLEIVEKDFNSMVVLFETVLYFAALYTIVKFGCKLA